VNIHYHIRQQVVAALKGEITQVEHFYSGRPIFIDIDQQKVAIAVFLEDTECEEITNCSREWNAVLNIALYLKTNQGEDELDSFAEQIKVAMDNTAYDSLDSISLMSYDIEQDQTNRTWFIGTICYQITYEE
jgi:phage minor tail protein U